jgi:hypothetical protein
MKEKFILISTQPPSDSTLLIHNCSLLSNLVKSGLGGAIAIENTLNIQKREIQLDLRDTLLFNNTSTGDASSVVISIKHSNK